MAAQWNDKVFSVTNDNFDAIALEIFHFQAKENPVYTEFLSALHVDPQSVTDIIKIPYLPVRFFKTHSVKTTLFEPEAIFESSGTTGSAISRHYIKDTAFYEQSFLKGFNQFYGEPGHFCIIGLLPSYLERKNSSLVYMVDRLIRLSGNPQSGFYLNEFEQLSVVLQQLENLQQPALLIGVTYALLDFAEQFQFPLRSTIIMETGGMKGRREELIRSEVHERLKNAFGIKSIHSEYGMTELMSQAYSKEDGVFNGPPWLKILLRDEEDPFLVKRTGSGTINIIDLANVYSCSFIAVDDIGRVSEDGSFEVLGRVDGSDLRGCSLMLPEVNKK